MTSISRLCLTFLTALLLFGSLPARADLIRVDFQTTNSFGGRNPINFTGVESKAAVASSLFASDGVNFWNELGVAAAFTDTTNPAFNNLLDSEGVATSVGISFTGRITAASDVPLDNSASDALQNDYLVINAGGAQASVGYSITGLAANTLETLYLYSPTFSTNRGYQLTANGSSLTVVSGSPGTLLAYVTTSSTGTISGTWSSGGEGDWSGFQISDGMQVSATPEPADLGVAGLIVLVVSLRRR